MHHRADEGVHDIPEQSDAGTAGSAESTGRGTGSVGLGDPVTALANVYLSGRSRVIASEGFTGNEFTLLACFLERDEWTATQLSGVIAADASRISRLVNGLVERGLLRRRRRVDDRRVVRLLLTEQGASVASALAERVREYDARLLAGVSDEEQAALVGFTSKVLANHSALQDGSSD